MFFSEDTTYQNIHNILQFLKKMQYDLPVGDKKIWESCCLVWRPIMCNSFSNIRKQQNESTTTTAKQASHSS